MKFDSLIVGTRKTLDAAWIDKGRYLGPSLELFEQEADYVVGMNDANHAPLHVDDWQ
jgi:hypothetical protein